MEPEVNYESCGQIDSIFNSLNSNLFETCDFYLDSSEFHFVMKNCVPDTSIKGQNIKTKYAKTCESRQYGDQLKIQEFFPSEEGEVRYVFSLDFKQSISIAFPGNEFELILNQEGSFNYPYEGNEVDWAAWNLGIDLFFLHSSHFYEGAQKFEVVIAVFKNGQRSFVRIVHDLKTQHTTLNPVEFYNVPVYMCFYNLSPSIVVQYDYRYDDDHRVEAVSYHQATTLKTSILKTLVKYSVLDDFSVTDNNYLMHGGESITLNNLFAFLNAIEPDNKYTFV